MSTIPSASVLESLFALVWQTSFQASVLIVLVLGLLFVFRKLSPGWKTLFAAVVFVRLLVPFPPESHFSIFNLWAEPTASTKQQGMFNEATLLDREAISNQQGTFDEATLLVRGEAISSTPHFGMSWQLAGSVIWIGGVVLILVVAAIRQFRLNRGLAPGSESWDDEQRVCFKKLGMRRQKPLKVCVSSRMNGPAIAGLIRPRLILPENFKATFSEAERHAILLHELAHLKRGDLVWSGLSFVVATLHWMNPLVWIVMRGFRRDLELACDATVLSNMKSGERPGYGRALLRVAEMISQPAERMTVLAAPFFNETSNLKIRIELIMNPNKTSKWGLVAMAGVVLILCLGTFTSATADDDGKAGRGEKEVEKQIYIESRFVEVGQHDKEIGQVLATAERLRKMGLNDEAREYFQRAAELKGNTTKADRDGDVVVQRRQVSDEERERNQMTRDGDRERGGGRESDVSKRRVESDGDVQNRLRQLEAENKKLRAEVARLKKVKD